ncbi:fasciclin domain-containing protein [Desertivirga brevis]|uniref:fasciclin domain-containing protein n=1 Tax=Desertivirga brevis TaxID=2810310 RepID=UPI001A96BC81|nr:fasciclin domain-containing protein [Pedobacter sp. SYSU D00873]
MMRSIQRLLYFLSAVFLFTGCNKKEWDEYYGRPDDLAPPIYQQLQAKGNFKTLLSVIDKSGYKDILGRSGAWTFFAPTDEAFQKFFQDNNIAGVDQVTPEMARKIATYGLVYNPFRKEELTSFQTPAGRIADGAFRRRTAYYDFVYTENNRKVVDNSRNGTTVVVNENNNKYIPYFIPSYFDFNQLNHASTYSSFYPGQVHSDFDVAGAKVIEANVPAENGIIHVIDKVITPLPNIEQYIASKPEYSDFKKLLDSLVTYIPNADFTDRYRVLTGSSDPVFIKAYNPGLAFSPNNESYLAGSTDGQAAAWSIAVPTNTALKPLTDVILEHYKTFSAAPQSLLLNLVNSHMWRVPVWPERVNSELNSQSENVTFSASNIVERKALSNGFLYGVNKAQEANVFRTIYAAAFLNPNYMAMTRAIDGSDLRSIAQTPSLRQTMILMNNVDLQAAGYRFREDSNQWEYVAPGTSPVFGAIPLARINRIIQSAVLTTPNGEFDNLSGTGIAEGYNGEYVKFENNRLQASGNVVDNSFVTVTGSRDYVNGKVYYASGVLKFAEDGPVTVGSTLESLSTSKASSFSHFFNYLRNSSLWNNTTKEISGVEKGGFSTLFVPTNAAIEQAIREGRLPGTVSGATVTPSFLLSQQSGPQRIAVENFIKYSFISKATVAIDGKKAAAYQTLLKTGTGDTRLIRVEYEGSNTAANFRLKDDSATPASASAILTNSNNLSNRALIHSINQVLKF